MATTQVTPTEVSVETKGGLAESQRREKITSQVIWILPAYNEERTVGGVVRVVKGSNLGRILVVSDGSVDRTVEVAERAGAETLTLHPNRGKWGAVDEGIRHAAGDHGDPIVALLDSDLLGLTAHNLELLLRPLQEGTHGAVVARCIGGDLRHRAGQWFFWLSGVRAFRVSFWREFMASEYGDTTGRFGLEIGITRFAATRRKRMARLSFKNVSQVMKEEKRGFLKGFKARLRMYGEILRFALKRKRRRSNQP
ncbi:MAG: glycosyltransferase [Parcubacteria group bacterium]|nr:glycosyltransferase [Parcubacteria group bacterium]